MNRVALGATVLAFSALGVPAAYAQSMSVKSAEVSDGGAMKEEQVLNLPSAAKAAIFLRR